MVKSLTNVLQKRGAVDSRDGERRGGMKVSQDGKSGLRKYWIPNEQISFNKKLNCLQQRCKAFVDLPLHLLLSLALFLPSYLYRGAQIQTFWCAPGALLCREYLNIKNVLNENKQSTSWSKIKKTSPHKQTYTLTFLSWSCECGGGRRDNTLFNNG